MGIFQLKDTQDFIHIFKYNGFGQGSNTSWYDKNGNLQHPPNNGAVPGSEKTVTLQSGSNVGRYGEIGKDSNFVTQTGVSADKLSLPPTTNPNTYQTLKVLKPIEGVTQSTVAPWGGRLEEVYNMSYQNQFNGIWIIII